MEIGQRLRPRAQRDEIDVRELLRRRCPRRRGERCDAPAEIGRQDFAPDVPNRTIDDLGLAESPRRRGRHCCRALRGFRRFRIHSGRRGGACLDGGGGDEIGQLGLFEAQAAIGFADDGSDTDLARIAIADERLLHLLRDLGADKLRRVLPQLGENQHVVVDAAGEINVAWRDMALDNPPCLLVNLLANAFPIGAQAFLDRREPDEMERPGGNDVAPAHRGGEACLEAVLLAVDGGSAWRRDSRLRRRSGLRGLAVEASENGSCAASEDHRSDRQNARYRRCQILALEGLGQYLVGADAERHLEKIGIADAATARHRDDRYFNVAGANLHDRLEALFIGHDDVSNDQLRCRALEGAQALLAVGRADDLMAVALKNYLNSEADGVVVVDYQNARHWRPINLAMIGRWSSPCFDLPKPIATGVFADLMNKR